MKKKVFAILTALLLLCACLSVGVSAEGLPRKTYGLLTYIEGDSAVHIVGCDPSAVEITIPREIEGKPVTCIEAEAFAGCDRLTSLTFYNQMSIIESYAFSDCTALVEVHYRTEAYGVFVASANAPLYNATWYYELPGDVDGNGKLNNRDLALFQQYLADWDVTVNEACADLNGDGKLNNRDLSRLQRILSDDNDDFAPLFNDVYFDWSKVQ